MRTTIASLLVVAVASLQAQVPSNFQFRAKGFEFELKAKNLEIDAEAPQQKVGAFERIGGLASNKSSMSNGFGMMAAVIIVDSNLTEDPQEVARMIAESMGFPPLGTGVKTNEGLTFHFEDIHPARPSVLIDLFVRRFDDDHMVLISTITKIHQSATDKIATKAAAIAQSQFLIDSLIVSKIKVSQP